MVPVGLAINVDLHHHKRNPSNRCLKHAERSAIEMDLGGSGDETSCRPGSG
jgi:hypothetical protein